MFSILGRLFQQYTIDEWIKIETQNLDFASFNQHLFRTDVSGVLLDIIRHGEREVSQVVTTPTMKNPWIICDV